jgi:hypothetical protein
MRPQRFRLLVHRRSIHRIQRNLHPIELHHQRIIMYVYPQRITIAMYLLTIMLAAQAWQKKACQAPVRNRGPLTRRIGTALIIISAVLIGLRFIARWRIQGTSIGWDDWTILLAWLGLIPSTAIVQLSKSHICSNTLTKLMRSSQ